MVDQTVAHDLVCTDAGSPIAPRSHPRNLRRNIEIVRRRQRGELPRQIAHEMGLTKNTVIGVCNRAGLSVPGFSGECVLRGEAATGARLSDAQVRDVRARYRVMSRSHGCRAIASAYGVSAKTIWDVVNRRSWAHVQ